MKSKYKEALKSLIYLAIVAAIGAALEYRMIKPKMDKLEQQNAKLQRELNNNKN
ncbi:hypothetical protein QQ054_01110 [Oscillatoria amoena NRMC-F 0135]|nr:hypothetical protein [Oscillatoria amoena NRMC-F 0135]